ncbi:tetratricopeptide repeat protein [Leptospira idonii]|uniref:Tetratricopeptide repeat protein n=1 Tax=Leptospira idonii TaxID=1193500 RepID=A0A4R9LZK3_9LEPT|nr:tetratricopeptide repeat protein [Leptospira idonii]TGN18925.1 tetratricopeptide repeat protein [Leptospira idonii]
MKTTLRIITVLFSIGLLYQCQSRDFKSVSVEDKVLSQADPSSKQKIEESRQILADGNLSFQKGNFEAAIQAAKEANLKYESVDGYSLLGASRYQIGDYEESKSAYLQGENLDPKNEKLLIGLGTVQSTLGENEEALSTYQKLSKLKPEEPVYQYKTGILLKNLKRYDESYVTLKPLEKNEGFPYPAELLNQLGDVCLELKKYEEAESYFAKAEKLQPDLKSAKEAKQSTKIASLIQRGNDAVAKKNYDSAIAEFKAAVDLQPSNASLWSFLGNAYFLKGNYGESENSFRKSVGLLDGYPNGYLGLANVYIKKKNYSECLKTVSFALKKNPRNAELKNKQGICEWKWGEPGKATLSFQDAGNWDKNFFEPKINLAYVLLDQGRNEEALEVLKKAESHPQAKKEEIKKAKDLAESQIYIAKGDSFLRQGKRKQALEEYGRALGKSPSDPVGHSAFGKAYFAFNEYKKSESSYLEALRLDPNHLGSVQGLARVYAKTGDSKKEKEYIKRLEKISNEDPFAAITLGRISEDAGKWDEAETTYLSLKKKFPENDAVNYRLGSLYYKRAVEENGKENYSKAIEFIQKSKKFTKEIPEVAETEKTIQENTRFAEILPLVREGNRLYDKKRYDEAIVPYQKAYDKVPKANLLVKIAECYMAKGEEEKGISILERAAKENKDNASSFREGIFAFFFKKGETSKAEEGFLSILKEKPDSYYSYYMLGLISMKKKDYETSLNQFDKSILLNGSFAPSNVAKGITLYKLGQTDSAKREFEKAREKDIQFSLSSYNLAIAYFNEDLISEAKSLLQSIQKSDPDFKDGEIQLAYIYFKENKLDEAEKSVLSVLKEETTAEALYAHFRILDAKYKEEPDDKIKTKRSAVRAQILKDFPDTKYASLLPSDTENGESILVSDISLSGSITEKPILYPNRIILNYGTSVVGLDRNSKEQVWKLYTSSPYSKLVASKQLLAFRAGLLQKIYPDSGKLGLEKNLLEGFVVKQAAANEDSIFYLATNPKSSSKKLLVLDMNGNKNFEWEGNDLHSFGLTTSGSLVTVRESKKEFLLSSVSSWEEKPKPASVLKKDPSDKLEIVGCLAHSCLVKLGTGYLEIDSKSKLTSLPSVGAKTLGHYEGEDGIHVRTSEKTFVWKEGGKWKESLPSDTEVRYSLGDSVLEAKEKALSFSNGSSKKKTIPWKSERDGKKITTVTVD